MTKPLKDEIPIEPLSDARWKKLDEAVFAALEARAFGANQDAGDADPSKLAKLGSTPPPARSSNVRRIMFVASGFAVAAVVLAFVWRGVLSPDASQLGANPSHIETGEGPSRIAIGESSVEVSPNSAVVTSGDAEHGVLVVLEKGRVECEVAPRKGRPPFVVQAGDVRVRVVGTRFAVERDAKNVHVVVSHGAVEVSGAQETVLLHDGESWPSSGKTPPSAQAPVPSDGTNAAPAPSAPSPSGGASIVIVAPGVPPQAPQMPQASPPVSDQRAYEGAARSEAKDPEAAMGAYKRLAASNGPWAAPALFAAGRLAADRGRNPEARKYLESYVARYPRGANADDARGILGRLQ